jgi:hypothetical protein
MVFQHINGVLELLLDIFGFCADFIGGFQNLVNVDSQYAIADSPVHP